MILSQLLRDNAQRKRQPFMLARNSGADEAALYLYDVISPDWGVSAMDFAAAIQSAGDAKTLHLYINSPGGDVFESRAMISALDRFPGKTVAHIDGLCASAATSVALACNEVEMHGGGFFMIHNAQCVAIGDKHEMRSMADLLEKVESAIVADYTNKTSKDPADIVAWMDAETWFTAAEAIEHGFVDRLAPDGKAAAKNTWNLAAFANAPAALKGPPEPPEPAPVQPPAPPEDSAAAPPVEPPADGGFFMTVANANRLRLLQIA